MTLTYRTFEELLAEIKQEAQNDPQVTTAIATQALKSAARKIAGSTKCLKTTWELSVLSTVTDGVYRIPDDLCAVEVESGRWGSSELPIRFVNPQEFASMRNGTLVSARTQEYPECYTIDGRLLKFYPIPQVNETFKLDGAEFPDDLAAGGYLTPPLNQFEEAIIKEAAAIALGKIGDKEEKANMKAEARGEFIDALRIHNERTPGYVTYVQEYDD